MCGLHIIHISAVRKKRLFFHISNSVSVVASQEVLYFTCCQFGCAGVSVLSREVQLAVCTLLP